MNVDELYKIIEKRKKSMPENSYIASLFNDGQDRIIQKIGEEASEVIIAAKNNKKEKIIEEVADLWFHILILLAACEIRPTEISQELKSRNKKMNKNMLS